MAGLIAAGCAASPGERREGQAQVQVQARVPDSCTEHDNGYDFLGVTPVIARQGATLNLLPTRDMSPAGPETVPFDCTSGWTISDPALATLSADHRTLRIADDARPGAEVELSYVVRGRRVPARLRIVGREQVVLTGARAQTAAEGCGDADRVGEIEFSPDRFAVTFRPFESYKDYWGTYRYDPATGALVMTVESGNYTPPVLDLEGTARLNERGQLVLEGMYLGSRNPARPTPGCRYTFG